MIIWMLTLAHAGEPLEGCKAQASGESAVTFRCGDDLAWVEERAAGSMEDVLVDYARTVVWETGEQLSSMETTVLLTTGTYRGYKVVLPPAKKDRASHEGVLLARPVDGRVRAAACVSLDYGARCERILEQLLAEGAPPGLLLTTDRVWLGRPLRVPEGCTYGPLGTTGGAIECNEDLLVWVPMTSADQARRAVEATVAEYASEEGVEIGPQVPCKIDGVDHTCRTLRDGVGTRAWFTAVSIGAGEAFQYCLTREADRLPPVCAQVLSVGGD